MKNIKIVFLRASQFLVLLLLVGCASYQINVNGYLAGNQVVKKGSILTIANNNAQNPILDQEIREKIKRGLALKGLKNVEELSNADYVLAFKYSIDSGETSSRTYSTNTQKTRLNIFSGKLEPYTETEVGSTAYTIFSRQLTLNLWDALSLKKHLSTFQQNSLAETENLNSVKPLWIGEIISRGPSSDLRTFINYLIVGALEDFGQNTKTMKKYTLSEYDKRAQALDGL